MTKETILALLIGIGGTKDLGERNPYLLLGGRIETQNILFEGTWDSSDKVESPGYRISSIAIWKYRWLRFGASYSYRHTEAWNKSAAFLITGAGIKRLEILFGAAINTPNNELKAELRIKSKYLELHSYYEYYNMTSNIQDHRFGMGSQLVLVLQ